MTRSMKLRNNADRFRRKREETGGKGIDQRRDRVKGSEGIVPAVARNVFSVKKRPGDLETSLEGCNSEKRRFERGSFPPL